MPTIGKRVYFDHAATTPVLPEVCERMFKILKETYGNPSSIHEHGRKAKSILESSRKKIADQLKVKSSEIFFTSGGTESDNWIIKNAVQENGIKHIVSTKIEHHAVLHTIEKLEKQDSIKVTWLPVNNKGKISYSDLESALQNNPSSLVSLMHANNEIGTLMDLERIGNICKQYNALFHSDTVQTVGQMPIELDKTPIDFIVGSAHKFNGPKGVGFAYIKQGSKLSSWVHGGGQERGYRAGTENLASIAGMALALEISCNRMHQKRENNLHLKGLLEKGFNERFTDWQVNGDYENSLHSVFSVCIPQILPNDLFLFQLDLHGISISGGSACSSGSAQGSHVLQQIQVPDQSNCFRISLGLYNTAEDVEFFFKGLDTILENVRSK
jgi:cysteine desulfurase